MTSTSTPQPGRQYGFRFSLWDAVVLLVTGTLSLWVRSKDFPLWWIVPAAVGHFFLFCNVFLVWRSLELIWAAILVVNVASHVATGHPNWWPALGWQLPVTAVVIALQLRSPWYHGILARRINPRLDDYLNGSL